MLRQLVARLRFPGAIALAVLYAVCTVLPSAALAFWGWPPPSLCPVDEHRQIHMNAPGGPSAGCASHASSDGMTGKHAGNSQDCEAGQPGCHFGADCGFLSFAAITGTAGGAPPPPGLSRLSWPHDERLESRAPNPIARPPKSFPPV
jgi:hypothetical protein